VGNFAPRQVTAARRASSELAAICPASRYTSGLIPNTNIGACIENIPEVRRSVMFFASRRSSSSKGFPRSLEGFENIDPGRSYIYAANHQSWFDIFAILGKLPVQFRWIAKAELFRIPVLGRAMSASGYIPIDRTDRRKAFQSIDQAALRVRNGTSILIFPEGTRSPDGIMRDFKSGGFILAIKSGQPILPLSISGSYRILPRGGTWLIHPGIIRISIGEAISTESVATRNREELMSRVREAILRGLTPEEGVHIRSEFYKAGRKILNHMGRQWVHE